MLVTGWPPNCSGPGMPQRATTSSRSRLARLRTIGTIWVWKDPAGGWHSPVWLIELVSIGRSEAKANATFNNGPYFGSILSSPKESQSPEERKQGEEEESFRVVRIILGKVYDRASIKFPTPQPGVYHALIVDMRGHLGGGDAIDWAQIACGAGAVTDFSK
jgi:hypothetical protein